MLEPKRGGNSRKFWITGVCLGLLVGGWFLQGALHRPDPASAREEKPAEGEMRQSANAGAAMVQTVPVVLQSSFRTGFEASGTLEAFKEVILQSKVSGRLSKLGVTEGERVEAGQVVAELDHRDQDAQVAATRAQIEMAKAEMAQAKAALNDAKRELDRYKRLLKEGYAKQQEIDTRQTTWESASAAYQSARATVDQYRATLRSQEVALSEYTLKAPFEGTVLDDYSLTTGTMIDTSTPVAKIGQVDVIKAVLQVPENRASRVREGMKALLTGNSFPGLTVEGHVYMVRPYVDTSTRTVEVEVTVDNKALGGVLKPGMFTSVFLVEGEAESARVLPLKALREGDRVLVVQEGMAHERAVEVGLVGTDSFEILSGVEEGDQVIVVGGDHLKDGDLVSVKKSGSGK